MLMQKLGFMVRMGRTAGAAVLLAQRLRMTRKSWRPRLTR